jgi:hypothetical protein
MNAAPKKEAKAMMRIFVSMRGPGFSEYNEEGRGRQAGFVIAAGSRSYNLSKVRS